MDKWLDGIQISESDKLKGNRAAAAANERKNIRRREKNYHNSNNNVNSEQIVNLGAVEGREHTTALQFCGLPFTKQSKARKGREVKVAQNKSSQNQ